MGPGCRSHRAVARRRPTPEGARLAALVLDACPPERATGLHQRAHAALGPAPAAAEIDRVLLAAGVDEAGRRDEPLASWLRIWAWSPVLPVPLLAGFAPLLAALRRIEPAVPPDPRTAARPHARHHTAAAASTARHPDAFPAGPAGAVLAALTLSRALPTPAPHVPDAAEFAGRAWPALLRLVWRTGTGLGDDLPAVLDHLYALAEPLTRPAPPPAGAPATPAPDAAGPADDRADGQEELPTGLLDTHPAVRALDCLLDYASGHATADGAMPGDVLRLVADVLAARGSDQAVAAVLGAHLPPLHRRATAFTTAHPELYALAPQRPSPAAAWLDRGGPDPLLLAALDRGQLLAAVRANLRVAAARVAFALLLDGQHDLLGDPADVWRELATGPDGTDGVSHLLAPLALSSRARPRTGDAAQNPAAGAPEDIARTWWTAALQAGLPPGALAAAGYFILSALPDEAWLPLARRSAEHTPAQDHADKIAERAAAHPRSPDALLLAAHLLTRPAPGPLYDADVRRHARALLQAAAALPEAERPAETEQLRRALVEAGEVDLAQMTTAG
ncbi:hypothetical protein [Streptomyces mutabilis]|uniref:hypothetical protein n=1 Tax=Streptomyces mutabilis TaxID=67332 RepID=UPI0007C82114|nr:hypothetical protein [Streptomyces mutabilis]